MGVIEQVSLLGRLERRNGPVPVAFVAGQDIGQDRRLVGRLPPRLRLQGSTAGTHFGVGHDEDFDVGVRANHGADVPAVQYRPWRVSGKLPLKIQQHLAHFRVGRDHGSGCADLVRFQRRIVEGLGVQPPRRFDRGGLIREVSPLADQRVRDSAVDRAGIEVTVAIMRGQALGERALARGRGSVDRNNHERSAPRERIIGMKSGKLVAMKAVSSTLTGSSEASPMTSADIAIRWSIWVATGPPPGTWPLPSTIRSSPDISTLTPLTRSMSAVASKRSDSLTRNSLKPRMMVVPSAKLAATASTRYSSIIEGARSGGTSTPFSFEPRTRSSAIGSPASVRTSRSSINPPISRSVVNSPARSGLVMTSEKIRSEPSTISAATIGNAAEDGSAGTPTFSPCSSGWPVSAILRPCRPSGVETIWAPKCRSINSVWSRLASFSITVVTPGAARPASSTADLICAEATGVR